MQLKNDLGTPPPQHLRSNQISISLNKHSHLLIHAKARFAQWVTSNGFSARAKTVSEPCNHASEEILPYAKRLYSQKLSSNTCSKHKSSITAAIFEHNELTVFNSQYGGD